MSTGMCFEIELERFSLEDLQGFLERISLLLTMPRVLEQLPGRGTELHREKLKLEERIGLLEDLERTAHEAGRKTFKCVSESNMDEAASVRRCSRSPKLQKKKYGLPERKVPSKKTESAKELRTSSRVEHKLLKSISSSQNLSDIIHILKHFILNEDHEPVDETLPGPSGLQAGQGAAAGAAAAHVHDDSD